MWLKLFSLVRTMRELESVVFKLLLCFQSRLYKEPHRFLRAALLRSAAARGGRLDLPVHNRVRPDVRLRIPAGVARWRSDGAWEKTEREGGEERRGFPEELLSRDHLLHRDCKPHPVRITHAVIGYHHQLHPRRTDTRNRKRRSLMTSEADAVQATLLDWSAETFVVCFAHRLVFGYVRLTLVSFLWPLFLLLVKWYRILSA